MLGFFCKPDEHIQPEGETAFRVRVRTARNGDIVELRLTKGNEISVSDGRCCINKELRTPW